MFCRLQIVAIDSDENLWKVVFYKLEENLGYVRNDNVYEIDVNKDKASVLGKLDPPRLVKKSGRREWWGFDF